MSLSIIPLGSPSLPTVGSPAYDALLTSLSASSTTLLASLPSAWTRGKTFSSTLTFSAHSPPAAGDTAGLRWHARISTHDERWDDFRAGLMVNHSVHEKEYVHSCVEARKVEVLEAGVAEVWQMSYKTPWPTTNRDFVFLLLTLDLSLPSSSLPTLDPAAPESPRRFQVISIPVSHPDAPPRKGFVRGRYVAVEQVDETEAGGVVWRMATASCAEGKIPQAVTDLAMPGTIAEDVPMFVNWLKKRPASA